MSVNFAALAAHLLHQAERLVPDWFPCGKRSGHEWLVGNLDGDAGDSLSINLNTGKWADFAGDESGGDLISLYAAKHRLTQLQAAKALANGSLDDYSQSRQEPPRAALSTQDVLERPPPSVNFHGRHPRLGIPTLSFRYADREGTLYWTCRYDPAGERKQFSFWRWGARKKGGMGWIAKAPPAPRALYRLDLLQLYPSWPVLLLEGEKKADVMNRLFQSARREAIAIAWAGGARALRKVDWSPLAQRNVMVWPDADNVGRQCMAEVIKLLLPLEARLTAVSPDGQPDGWDVADAVQEGWTLDQIQEFAREHKKRVERVPPTPQLGEVVSDDGRARTTGTSEPAGRDLKPGVASGDNTPEVEAPAAPPPDDSTVSFRSLWDQYGLALDSKGRPHTNIDNVVRVLAGSVNTWGKIWYDEFLRKVIVESDGVAREWSDVDEMRLTLWLQRAVGLHAITTSISSTAAIVYAHSRIKNCAQDYLRLLTWDGENRLQDLLPVGFGAKRNVYSEGVGRCFIMGMVARVLRPGCKVDNMPVFEGPEGILKSTALQVLGGDWFSTTHEKVGTKDFYLVFAGKMLIEIEELQSFSGAEVERIKGVISTQTDRFRAPYARAAADHPRMVVFAGSTNRDDYIHSTTGMRRFWPVRCGRIRIEWLRQNRAQLLAEAVARVQAGEKWYDVHAASAEEEQKARMKGDMFDGMLSYYLSTVNETTVVECVRKISQADAVQWNRLSQDRIEGTLTRAGFRKINGRWLRRDSIVPEIDESF